MARRQDENATELAEQDVSRWVLEGRFDALIAEKGSTRPDKGALEKVKRLARALGVDPAPASAGWPTGEEKLQRAARFYRRASILLELWIERPLLVREIPTPVFPDADSTWKLIERWPWQREAAGPAHAAGDVPGIHDVRMIKHVLAYYIIMLSSGYQIFRTKGDDLERISTKLDEVERRLDRLGFPDQGQDSMQAIRGLLHLHVGRVFRALAGDSIGEAETRLTRALAHYANRAKEKRAGRGEPDPEAAWKDTHHYLVSGSYRSSIAILQLAYLAFVRGRSSDSLRQLKEARLMAMWTDNQVLDGEIDLVELSVRTAQLDPTLLANGDAREAARRKAVIDELDALIHRNREEGRIVYALMAMYQRALCDLLLVTTSEGGEPFPALARAEEMLALAEDVGDPAALVGAQASAGGTSNLFWSVSSLVLKIRAYLRLVACERDAARRHAHLRRAIDAGNEALGRIGDNKHLENLRVQCHAYLGDAYMRDGQWPSAEKHLEQVPNTSPAGYTSTPYIAALGALSRAELAARLGRPREAAVLITAFEHAYLPHPQNPEVTQRYEDVRKVLNEETQWVVTDQEIRDDMAKDARDRSFTYVALRNRLKRYLYAAALRINNEDDDLKQIAKITGMSPNTVLRVRENVTGTRSRASGETGRKSRRARGARTGGQKPAADADGG